MKIEYYLPEKVFTNDELVTIFPNLEASRVEEKLGIRQRHIASADETALDLAFEAAKKVLNDFDKEKIDFILLCTQSPDYFLPTSACLLQSKLGIKKSAGALDFNLGSSGFIYGLALAKGLLQSQVASNVLLVNAETYTKHIHPDDRANRSIFGDGAAATIIGNSDKDIIKEFVLGTDGKGFSNLIVTNGAMRHPFGESTNGTIDENGNFFSPDHLYMNGPEIFNFTIENIPLLVENVLKKNDLTLDQIDYFIFHQANKYMLEYLRKKIKIPQEKYYNDILMTGNTVATIPIALKESIDRGIVHPGNKILLAGFGVGYSWGATVIEL
ncbi:MAG: ketoacyl-ACP synthase III [Bacteroidetes bacterium]|nr:ketoacyl-ACP synthase III [Bacteroidota bacterium]